MTTRRLLLRASAVLVAGGMAAALALLTYFWLRPAAGRLSPDTLYPALMATALLSGALSVVVTLLLLRALRPRPPAAAPVAPHGEVAAESEELLRTLGALEKGAARLARGATRRKNGHGRGVHGIPRRRLRRLAHESDGLGRRLTSLRGTNGAQKKGGALAGPPANG